MDIYELINHDIACTCGRTHRCDIKGLQIGENALSQLPKFVADFSHILLVADNNTFPLCGDEVSSMLKEKLECVCIFHTEHLLIPNEESIAKICSYVSSETDLILGIGSGVINDLCKYVAFTHDICSGIIATAPSMDGYASSGAAMILNGMKVTFTARAPIFILGDVGILKSAPKDMIRSGYADIIGKYSALCDWKLSHLINGEYFCQFVYDIVLHKTDEVRLLAEALTRRESEAIRSLMEGLVLIGVCFTLLSTTRPGSGSEHHLSHYFEITGLIDKKPYFLHGTDVGYGTLLIAGLRDRIRKTDKPSFYQIDPDTRKAFYKSIYKEYWQEVWKIQQKAGWYDKDMTNFYITHWDEIRAVLAQSPSQDEIRKMLTDIGFDLSAFEKMYGKEKIELGIWFAKDLKDRYTVLWLYDELFLNDELLKKLQNRQAEKI